MSACHTDYYYLRQKKSARTIHLFSCDAEDRYQNSQNERQSVGMSKITNDGLTRSGTGCFTAVHT